MKCKARKSKIRDEWICETCELAWTNDMEYKCERRKMFIGYIIIAFLVIVAFLIGLAI